MKKIEIKPVQSRDDQADFLRLPRTLHKDTPAWVPRDIESEAKLVGFEPHPFYDAAESQAFVAYINSEPSGRIAAIANHTHNRFHKTQDGFFGFFESVNDQEVANRLFDAAKAWLAERSFTSIRGPVSPSITYQCGLLLDGFDKPPSYLMPHNPQYYLQLVEGYGFQAAQNLLTYAAVKKMMKDIDPKILAIPKMAMERFGIEMRHFEIDRFDEDVAVFYDIYNQSLKNMWGFTPVTDSEVQLAGKELREIVVPEMTSIAMIKGKPVGALLGILDFNPLIKECDGNLNWSELGAIYSSDRKPTGLRMPCTLVLPEYQMWGVGPLLINFIMETSLDWGIDKIEFSWITESNGLSNRSLERGGAARDRAFRVYEMPIL